MPNAPRKGVVCFRIIAGVALISIAIWDAKKMIQDYLENNRYTVVELKNISDRYPFLRNPRICLNSGNRFLFSEFESDNLTLLNKSGFLGQMTDPTFWLRLFHIMKLLDAGGVDALNESVIFTTEEILDGFINFESVEFVKKAWLQVQNIFVSSLNPNPRIILDYITFSKVCFFLPLADELLLNVSYVNYNFDFQHSKWANETSNKRTVQVCFLKTCFDFKNNYQNKLLVSKIAISNNGLFDSTGFPFCTEKHESEEDCLNDIFFKTISDNCDCIQFSGLVQYSFKNFSYERPICNVKSYKHCFYEGYKKAIILREQAMADKICVPCVVAKNVYRQETSYINVYGYFTTSPSVSLIFGCTETGYTLFQDQYKCSLAQLIAQIGGDVGLYTGFSMFSIIELIIFFYNLFINKDQGAINQNGRWKQFCLFLCNIFKTLFGLNPEDGSQTTTRDQISREWVTEEFNRLLDKHQKEKKNRKETLYKEGSAIKKQDQNHREVNSIMPRVRLNTM